MRTTFMTITLLLLLSSCGTPDGDWSATGSFEATEIIVSSEATGRILELNIEEGAVVKTHQRVGQVDTVQLYLRRKQLLSSYQSILSRRPDVQRQIASLKQRLATAERDEDRLKQLVASNAANQKQLDDMTSQRIVYQKELDAQLYTLNMSHKGVQSEAESIESQIAQLEDQLLKCRIYSPIDGTVLACYAEQGEMTASGKALFKVADLTSIYLRAYLTADLLTQIKLGDEVEVLADFGKDQKRNYKGRVSWISDKSEFTPKTIPTRDERANMVYAVKILIPNDGYLKIGMYGQVRF